VRFKYKLRLKQAIKIHHHLQEWNHQVFKLVKKKVKLMVTIMDGALIKGENKVVKPKKKLHKLKMMMLDQFNVNLKHHTQEYIKWFNGIIRRQHTWEHSKRGDNSLKVDKLLCILLVCLLFGTS
jgi:hypothetical protein